MKKKTFDWPFLFIIFTALFALWVSLASYADIPIVRTSWLTKKCVKVEQPKDSHYTCDNLPKRYLNTWSK